MGIFSDEIKLKWCTDCREGVTNFCRGKSCESSCKLFSLKPCPFCGMKMSIKDQDTMHPSGIGWRQEEAANYRHYINFRDPRGCHGYCWEINCQTIYGGCGATISADSFDETIEKWNTRVEKE